MDGLCSIHSWNAIKIYFLSRSERNIIMTTKNIVPCKRCTTDFHYTPGAAGNARQLCDPCRMVDNEKEVEQLKEEMVVEKNRYLMSTPKRKSEYDPISILVDGVIPVFTSAADRFICTMEIATFVKRTGITGLEDGIAKFLDMMPPLYVTLFIKQQDLSTMERFAKDARFKNLMRTLMKVAI